MIVEKREGKLRKTPKNLNEKRSVSHGSVPGAQTFNGDTDREARKKADTEIIEFEVATTMNKIGTDMMRLANERKIGKGQYHPMEVGTIETKIYIEANQKLILSIVNTKYLSIVSFVMIIIDVFFICFLIGIVTIIYNFIICWLFIWVVISVVVFGV